MSLTYKVVISDEAISDLRRYQLEGDTAYVTNIFHGLEDVDNKLR